MRLTFLSYLLLVMPIAALAEDKVNFSGFGTIGAVYSDSNHYGYRKDISSDNGVYQGDLDFKSNSLLGLQADFKLFPNTEVVLQTVLRDIPVHKLDRYISLAFMRYTLDPNWTFRVGRTPADLFLITEFRDINFSYIWTTPPNEVYSIVPFRNLDGADVTYTTRINDGSVSFKLFMGQTEGDVISAQSKDITKLKNIYGLSLSYDNFNWFIQGKYTEVVVANIAQSALLLNEQLVQLPESIWPNVNEYAQALISKGDKVKYHAINSQYTDNQWLYSAEIARISSKNPTIPTVLSAYAALSYEYENYNFYTIYAQSNSERYQFNEPDVNVAYIPELIYGVTAARNFFSTNQKTISLGWRNNLSSNTALSIQLNQTRVDAQGGTLWLNKQTDASKTTISTLLANFSFTF